MTACGAFILGCSGQVLSSEERAFFRDVRPWGLILFRRNVSEPQQVADLCAAFRDLVGRDNAPVLVDQEGGRVQRLGVPHWRRYPAAWRFLEAAKGDVAYAARLAGQAARLMAHDLNAVGITIDCLPVLDCPIEGAHDAIGDRAYARDPGTIADGLLKGGVLPVMKHMPGHGRATVDSHLALPLVTASRTELAASDFAPFKALNDLPIGMTGHIVFSDIDPTGPATASARVIEEVIRGEIGFDGLLLSDDLSMQALSRDFAERTRAGLDAGCDIVLHCNGVMAEARAVADAARPLSGAASERAFRALSRVKTGPEPFDPVDAARELDAALAPEA